MNKYLNYLVAYLLSLAALSSCSDDNEPTPVPVPDPTPSGYCLMFYMSGGDPEHDILLMESARQAAEATGDDVAVTILMKASGKGEGEAHNGTCRYTAQDGVLTQDTEFAPSMTSPSPIPPTLPNSSAGQQSNTPAGAISLPSAGTASLSRPKPTCPIRRMTPVPTGPAPAPRCRTTAIS